jgi:lipopolysaccharide transport system permease protein
MEMNSNNSDKQQWTETIASQIGWLNVNIRDIWSYRDLIMLFVRRDFTSIYKQTILGPLWFLVQPIITTLVFTVVFGMIAKIPTDGIPPIIFYLAGITCWNYFSSCLGKTSETFVSNAGLFGKVYFPRLTVPISNIITNFFTFLIQFFLFFGILTFYYFTTEKISPNLWILVTPFLLLQMAMLGLGVGLSISALTTKYRDLFYVIGFGVQLWMYATPIVYPMSQVPEQWKWVFIVNPMAAIIDTFRYAFIGTGSINYLNLAISVITTCVVLFLGLLLFGHNEKNFIDIV